MEKCGNFLIAIRKHTGSLQNSGFYTFYYVQHFRLCLFGPRRVFVFRRIPLQHELIGVYHKDSVFTAMYERNF